jgi:hypothetical protein|tara:strand:+ start:152 stop:331 length:180 start_codon:yes stop_codon:yes gene_type:complete
MEYIPVTKSLNQAVEILDTTQKDEEHNMVYSREYDVDALMSAISTALLILRARIARKHL